MLASLFRMKIVPFIADTPALAVAQIHEQLGPDAVVLSVRPLPAPGLSRLWQSHRQVEVLAGVVEDSPQSALHSPPSETTAGSSPSTFHVSRFTQLSTRHAPPALHANHACPHVFIGPPGVGKTTLLCKWLARSVLMRGLTARVWRLDGASANTAEFLNVYAELFSLPVERFWEVPAAAELGRRVSDSDLLLVDLPGAEAGDRQTLSVLAEQLHALPNPRVHLVLNAAYDLSVLFEQVRSFASFEPEDLSFTHLDEMSDLARIENLLSGTGHTLRFVSAGQKIPGDFFEADDDAPSPSQQILPNYAGIRESRAANGLLAKVLLNEPR